LADIEPVSAGALMPLKLTNPCYPGCLACLNKAFARDEANMILA
jgi:hypothetical protein